MTDTNHQPAPPPAADTMARRRRVQWQAWLASLSEEERQRVLSELRTEELYRERGRP
jgi:hypothetical protein